MAHTAKEKLKCPKCKTTFVVRKHQKNRKDKCPKCSWAGSFHYVE